MKTCPTCQQTYPDDVESCPRDGSQLAAEFREERECPYCAEMILKKAHVCKHCGHDGEPLTGGDTSVQAQPSAPALGIPEARKSQPLASRPGTAAQRPTTASTTPWLRAKPEPSGKMKFILLGGAALILVVAGVWYFSHRKTQPSQMAKENAKVGEAVLTAGTVRENPKDGLKYVWIPPGTFMMGCSPGDNECRDDEKPAHQVTITKGFWIGQTEVTVGAYRRFTGVTGRQMPHAPDFNYDWTYENMPIVTVTWDDAKTYCGWIGGRLPTEAEWEYAARGGSTVARYGDIDEIAWYLGNAGPQPHEVAQKRPNGFGLYDMLGNVFQWVNDWYDENNYQHSLTQDPTGPSSGDVRVLRGGPWDHYSRAVRVSDRYRDYPAQKNSTYGFRCAGEAIRVVPVSSPQAPALQEAKEAEDGAMRKQEQEAKRLHDTLGDKLSCQLSTLGMLGDGQARVSIGNGLEAAIPLGYEIRDLVMFVNRNNGTLSIGFRCKASPNTYVNPHKMIVRLFDANGEYLTHFITAEWFKTPVCLVHPAPDNTACFMGSAHLGGPVIQLREDVNFLQYRINIRDAAFVQRAEFGPYFR